MRSACISASSARRGYSRVSGGLYRVTNPMHSVGAEEKVPSALRYSCKRHQSLLPAHRGRQKILKTDDSNSLGRHHPDLQLSPMPRPNGIQARQSTSACVKVDGGVEFCKPSLFNDERCRIPTAHVTVDKSETNVMGDGGWIRAIRLCCCCSTRRVTPNSCHHECEAVSRLRGRTKVDSCPRFWVFPVAALWVLLKEIWG